MRVCNTHFENPCLLFFFLFFLFPLSVTNFLSAVSQTDLSLMNVIWDQTRTDGFGAKQDLMTN